MINEVTKNPTTTATHSKKQVSQHDSSSDDRETSQRDNNIQRAPYNNNLAALSIDLQQYLLAQDNLYKCSSGDSLSSLQNFVSSSSTLSSSKKFIVEDTSDYSLSSITNLGQRLSATHHHKSWSETNFLKPRMEFTGYQISGYKKYQVVVNLKTVELPKDGLSSLSPHLTGFLTIKGLTNQHPEISTYFEAFAVTHKDLGFLSSTWSKGSIMNSYRASDQTDLEHWLNFPSFKQLFLSNNSETSQAPTISELLNGQESFGDYLENRYIFMRWKEKFLVPDALVDGVEGASYDGFYYIVHDQVTGTIQGFYYHQDAEKFQQLELVPSFRSLDDCSSCSFDFA